MRTLVLLDDAVPSGAPPAVPMPLPQAELQLSPMTLLRAAAIEYCRVVLDLFPTDQNVAVMQCTEPVQKSVMLDWSACKTVAPLPYLVDGLQGGGEVQPQPMAFADMVPAAVSMLAKPLVDVQQPAHNRTRVVLFTTGASIVDPAGATTVRYRCARSGRVFDIADLFAQYLAPHRRTSPQSSSDRAQWPITHCAVEIVAISRPSDVLLPTKRIECSSQLSLRCRLVPGPLLFAATQRLVQLHHNLGCVIVANIPMKEASSTTEKKDYEVPMLFCQADHVPVVPQFVSRAATEEDQQLGLLGFGEPPAMLPLKWSVRPAAPEQSEYCSRCVHRVTPLDVMANPTTSLVKYVFGGKTVYCAPNVAAVPKGAAISHLVLSQQDEMVLRCIHFASLPPQAASPLLDPATLRSDDFGVIMDVNDLSGVLPLPVPLPLPTVHRHTEQNPWLVQLQRDPRPMAAANLERSTRSWPTKIGESALDRVSNGPDSNLKENLRKLQHLVQNPYPTVPDIDAIQKIIRSLATNKNMRKDIEYLCSVEPAIANAFRSFWEELAGFTERYNQSKIHHIVDSTLTSIQQAEEHRLAAAAAAAAAASASEVVSPLPSAVPEGKQKREQIALQQASALRSMTTRERQDFLNQDANNEHLGGGAAREGTPVSSSSSLGKAYLLPRNLLGANVDVGSPKSLLYLHALSSRRHQSKRQRTADFDGRIAAAANVVASTSVDSGPAFSGPQSYE